MVCGWRCIGPRAKEADLWILIWKNCLESSRRHTGGVEHAKAHRSKKDIRQMSLFEKFTTEGNERR